MEIDWHKAAGIGNADDVARHMAFANLGKDSLRESVMVTISADGKQTREVIFSTKDAEVTIKPRL